MAEQRTRLSPAELVSNTRADYEAFAHGDVARVAERWTDDITWHARGSTQFGGTFRGRDEIFGYLGRLQQEFEDFRLEVHDILANEEHVVALLGQTAKRHGETYEGPAVHVHHVDEQGRIKESWFIGDTEQLRWALEH